MYDTPVSIGLGFSSASSAQSGGPFTNNSDIVFGEGIFGATSQDEAQTATPTASTSVPVGATVANPYAPNAAVASGSGGSNSTLIYAGIGIIIVAGLAIWLVNRKG